MKYFRHEIFAIYGIMISAHTTNTKGGSTANNRGLPWDLTPKGQVDNNYST